MTICYVNKLIRADSITQNCKNMHKYKKNFVSRARSYPSSSIYERESHSIGLEMRKLHEYARMRKNQAPEGRDSPSDGLIWLITVMRLLAVALLSSVPRNCLGTDQNSPDARILGRRCRPSGGVCAVCQALSCREESQRRAILGRAQSARRPS